MWVMHGRDDDEEFTDGHSLLTSENVLSFAFLRDPVLLLEVRARAAAAAGVTAPAPLMVLLRIPGLAEP